MQTNLQLPVVDRSARGSMKAAAKCATACESQDYQMHRPVERTLRRRHYPVLSPLPDECLHRHKASIPSRWLLARLAAAAAAAAAAVCARSGGLKQVAPERVPRRWLRLLLLVPAWSVDSPARRSIGELAVAAVLAAAAFPEGHHLGAWRAAAGAAATLLSRSSGRWKGERGPRWRPAWPAGPAGRPVALCTADGEREDGPGRRALAGARCAVARPRLRAAAGTLLSAGGGMRAACSRPVCRRWWWRCAASPPAACSSCVAAAGAGPRRSAVLLWAPP